MPFDFQLFPDDPEVHDAAGKIGRERCRDVDSNSNVMENRLPRGFQSGTLPGSEIKFDLKEDIISVHAGASQKRLSTTEAEGGEPRPFCDCCNPSPQQQR